jgi:hypothetical protein
MAHEALVAEFDEEMFRIYQRAHSEANYNATRFLKMLHEHRGLETARILLHSANVSEGYAALWERGSGVAWISRSRQSFTTTPSGIRCLQRTSWPFVASGSRITAISTDNEMGVQQTIP